MNKNQFQYITKLNLNEINYRDLDIDKLYDLYDRMWNKYSLKSRSCIKKIDNSFYRISMSKARNASSQKPSAHNDLIIKSAGSGEKGVPAEGLSESISSEEASRGMVTFLDSIQIEMKTGGKQKKLLIFTGAGFSKSISPDQMLTTDELYKRCIDENRLIKEHSYYHYLSYLLNVKNYSPDVETFANKTREMIKSIKTLTIPNNTPEDKIVSEQIGIMNRLEYQNNNRIVEKLEEFNVSVNIEMLRALKYRGSKNDEQIIAIRQFIEDVKEKTTEFVIFSTNYDDLFKYIHPDPRYYIDDGDKIDMDKLISESETYSYIPLKGRLDWAKNKENDQWEQIVPVGGSLNDMALLPLEFIGEPQGNFKRLYDEFEQRLESSTHLIFIGFSFRDQHINELIRQHCISKKHKILIITGEDWTRGFEQRLDDEVFLQYRDDTIWDIEHKFDKFNKNQDYILNEFLS